MWSKLTRRVASVSTGRRSSHHRNQKQQRSHQSRSYATLEKEVRRRAKGFSGWSITAALVATGLVVFEAIEQLNKYLDNLEIPEKKEKVVVLGSGWAALAAVKDLNRLKYDVTVISPRNYFVFTPLMGDAAIGAIDAENIMQPFRDIAEASEKPFTFLEAAATEIDPETNTVKIKTTTTNETMSVEYDKLIMAVGSVSRDYKIPGAAENTIKLRDWNDAKRIRNKIVDILERASLPTTSDEERSRLLRFIVVGGSPYSAEFAADLNEYVRTNANLFNADLSKYINVTLIDSTDHISNFYDKSISKAMRKRYLYSGGIQVIGSDVSEIKSITPDLITMTEWDEDLSAYVTRELHYGLAVWGAGGAPHPLVEQLRTKLPSKQFNSRAIVTDSSLCVLGTSNIYAMGDCATVDQGSLMRKWNEVFKKADTDQNGMIDFGEFESLVKQLSRRYPAMKELLARARPLFEEFDVDNSGALSEDEFQKLLKLIESNLTRFPATATVAVQQGRFLAKTLNKLQPEEDGDDEAEEEEEKEPVLSFEERAKHYKTPLVWYAYKQLFSAKEEAEAETAADAGDSKSEVADKKDNSDDKKDDEAKAEDNEEEDDPNKPVFRYKHIGGFEYVGAEDGFVERGSKGTAIVTGPGAMWMWRAVYFSKSLSLRMHTRLWYDWLYYRIFGRSATRL